MGGIGNILPKTVNAISGNTLDLPTFEPFEKKVPFEKATAQANEELKQAKKNNPEFKVTPEDFNKRVKDIFVEQQKQNQYQENASNILADENPEVQERIKGKFIKDIGNLDKNTKANSVQIQILDNKATPLRAELLETKKLIDAGKADSQTIQDFNTKLQDYTQIEKEYGRIAEEQSKNTNKKLTAEDRLKLFKLDYNPYSKAIDDLTAPTAKMLGEGLYALGKTADKMAELPIIGDDRKEKGEKSIFTNAGNSLIESADEVSGRHRAVSFSDIDGFGKLGSWTTQTVGQVTPYVLGSAIGTTEEQALSKAFLTPSKALAGFSTASAGGAMHEMDSEMANNPDVKYNNWQYAGKVLGSVGSNAIMFGNYGAMLKGNKALFESIAKTPEANVEFQKGVKEYLDSAIKSTKEVNKSGAIMMGSQAINMFVDNHILGKKHEDGFDELANAYIEGGAMHTLIATVPNLATNMIEKVLPNESKRLINENLKKGYGLTKELENPALTSDERKAVQSKIDEVHKDNERLLKASNKQVEGFTQNQVKELLTIDQDKFAITKDVEEIKNGNYSKEYKESALAEKKAEFKQLEDRRQDVFGNEHNALTLLPKSEQNRLEREAKTRIAEKDGKEVEDMNFDAKEVNDTALRIHKSEFKEQTVKNAETKIVASETESQAEIQKPIDTIQESEKETIDDDTAKILNPTDVTYNITNRKVAGEDVIDINAEAKDKSVGSVSIKKDKEGIYSVIDAELYNDNLLGKGIGKGMYDQLVKYANDNNIEIYSDAKIFSKDAQKVWSKLVKEGKAEFVKTITGNPEYTDEKEFPQYKIIKEDAKKEGINSPDDGIVGTRNEPSGESGIIEQQTIKPKSVPETSNNRTSETPVEVIKDKDGKEYTSLKKVIYDAEREAQGKEVVNTTDKQTPKEVREGVEAKIKSGEVTEQEIRDLATALANGENIPTKLKGEEIQYALLHDKVTLEKEGRRIDSEIEKAVEEKDLDKHADLILEKAQNELLAEDNYIASKKTGSEASRILNAKKAGLDEDYSYRTILDRVQELSKDKEIPQEVKDRLKNMSQQITDLQTKIDDYQARFDAHDAEVKKLEGQKAEFEDKISKTKGEEKLEKLKALKDTKEVKKASIEKKKLDTINTIKAKYKRLSGNLSSGGNLKLLELAPDITALAKLHVQEGVVELEELIGKMLVELQDAIPNLTERDLRDVFSGYGKLVKPNTDENATTLAQLKSKARVLSGLEDVKDLGVAPLKSGVTHRLPTPEVLELRKEIKREMRERGIDISKEKDPEDVWKTSLESYKTKIKNRIEYLENINETKNIDKFLGDKKKTKLKLDDEARELKKQQQKIKNKVDDAVTKADFETWSKYRKALHFSGRYAKGVLISSPVTLVKILSSVGWRVAYKPLHATSMYGMSKIFPKLAETQGINSRKDLADHLVEYYSTAFSKKNVDKFIDTFKNHASEEDLLFGKHYSNVPIPKIKGNDNLNIIQKGFFGHLKFLEDINASSHGAMKNLVALPEYTAWKQTILRNLIKEGIPKELLDNGNAEQIAHQLAFLKGQRARFMQKNMIAEQQTALEARLRNKGLHGTAEAINFLLPIVKIGSNFVGESLEKQPAIGLIPNGANLLKARESLTEKQKSDLLRTLSYQGVGFASFLAGAYMYQNISPFYGTSALKQAKKDGKDLPEEDESLGFLKGAYTHAPDAVNMRAGATFMWYWDKLDKMNETQGEKHSMMNFMGALFNREILGGIVSQSPYISASESTIGPLLNSQSDLGKAEANFIRSRVPFGDFTKTLAQGELPIANKLFPETGKKLAEKVGMHPEEVRPSEVKISPKGLKDNLLIGLPKWREEVLRKLYDDKYGAGKITKDINEEIDKISHEGEAEENKQKFLEGLEK